MVAFNPEWTTEEAYFWERHMQEYGDIWWNVGPLPCGHPRSGHGRYHMSAGEFRMTCALGHVAKYPVLRSSLQDVAEGTLLW